MAIKKGWVWDEKTRRYVDPNGKAVSERRLNAWVVAILGAFGIGLGKLATSYLTGKRSLAEYQVEMQQQIRDGHRAMGVLANGGYRQMTAAAWGQVGGIVARESTYAVRLASELARDEPRRQLIMSATGAVERADREREKIARDIHEAETAADREMMLREIDELEQQIRALEASIVEMQKALEVSAAQLLNRSTMYADALYSTHENAILQRERRAGVIEARRILDPEANHCLPDPKRNMRSCPELAEDSEGNQLDWARIEDVVPIGETPCAVNCRCSIEYRRETAAEPAEREQAA
jgi:hypothetical protein